eukprot:264834_1
MEPLKRSKSLSLATLSNLIDPRNISIRGILSESWLVANLTVELALNLGSRLIWIWMFFRFLLYVSLLMLPLARAGWVFMISDYIKRNEKYGSNPRNYLDIYMASNIMEQSNQSIPTLNHKGSSHKIPSDTKYPVVIFISGGAWIIGYKAWGAFMGMLLAQLGVVFVAPDYRNFPQGTVTDMVTDVTNAVQWTRDNIDKYGGDKTKIYLISQSAGAHIASLTLLLQARKLQIYDKLQSYLTQLKHENQNQKEIELVCDKLQSNEFDALWNPQQDLTAFVGVSGVYNMSDMTRYLNQRGLYTDIIYKIMDNDLRSASPFYCLYDLFIHRRDNKRKLKPINKINCMNSAKAFVSMTEIRDANDDGEEEKERNEKCMHLDTILNDKVELKLPNVYLFHGTSDQSVPVSNTKAFSLSLANFGVQTYIKLYPNKTHTAPIIEDPITGCDPLVCDMLQIIYPNQSLTNIVHEIEETLTGGVTIPQCIIDVASFVCPF